MANISKLRKKRVMLPADLLDLVDQAARDSFTSRQAWLVNAISSMLRRWKPATDNAISWPSGWPKRLRCPADCSIKGPHDPTVHPVGTSAGEKVQKLALANGLPNPYDSDPHWVFDRGD